MKPIVKRIATVSSLTAASIGSLFIQTVANADNLANTENGFSSDSTIKTVYTETVDTTETTAEAVDIFDNKAIAITGLDVYESTEEGAAVVGKLEDKNIADVVSTEGDMTLIKSGNLEGYVESESLVIGDEAEAVAYSLTDVTATAKQDSAEVYSLDEGTTVQTVDSDVTLKVISTDENKLIVELDGTDTTTYVNANDVDVDFGLETGKTNEEIAAEEEAAKAAEEAASAETETEEAETSEETTSTSSTVVNGAYASHITKSSGVFDGPSGYETYYNLSMSGVISAMRSLGYAEEDGWVYWVREDGVKMFGDYVMVAADLSIRPKGTILECSMGTAIVCDTGDFVYSNPYQLDIAVSW